MLPLNNSFISNIPYLQPWGLRIVYKLPMRHFHLVTMKDLKHEMSLCEHTIFTLSLSIPYLSLMHGEPISPIPVAELEGHFLFPIFILYGH